VEQQSVDALEGAAMNAVKPMRAAAVGTRPQGTATEAEAARNIREMFGGIAPRYDFLNHFLSLNLDRVWRRRVTRRFAETLARKDATALDLCCGTGDLALALAEGAKARVFGSDFAQPMLIRATAKAQHTEKNVPFLGADALALPFADSQFDLVTVSFGFRNLANYGHGLEEMFRILRRGGEAGILEFCEPHAAVLGPLYRFYFRRILPVLGRMISGHASAYSYLPASVAKFPDPERLAEMMRAVGFSGVTFETWTFGTVALHRGKRA
jgi:demethylmenaquinone methyltransferase/2-methoxy-6-polyprenyl-1,4-benzoquinol methylase